MNKQAFIKAYNKIKTIDTAEQLRREGLTLCEYNATRHLLKEYYQTGQATTFLTAAAEFFKKCGFDVQLATINYIIK